MYSLDLLFQKKKKREEVHSMQRGRHNMVQCIFMELKYEKRKAGEVRKRHYSRPPSPAKYPGVLPEENRELLFMER